MREVLTSLVKFQPTVYTRLVAVCSTRLKLKDITSSFKESILLLRVHSSGDDTG